MVVVKKSIYGFIDISGPWATFLTKKGQFALQIAVFFLNRKKNEFKKDLWNHKTEFVFPI